MNPERSAWLAENENEDEDDDEDEAIGEWFNQGLTRRSWTRKRGAGLAIVEMLE